MSSSSAKDYTKLCESCVEGLEGGNYSCSEYLYALKKYSFKDGVAFVPDVECDSIRYDFNKGKCEKCGRELDKIYIKKN